MAPALNPPAPQNAHKSPGGLGARACATVSVCPPVLAPKACPLSVLFAGAMCSPCPAGWMPGARSVPEQHCMGLGLIPGALRCLFCCVGRGNSSGRLCSTAVFVPRRSPARRIHVVLRVPRASDGGGAGLFIGETSPRCARLACSRTLVVRSRVLFASVLLVFFIVFLGGCPHPPPLLPAGVLRCRTWSGLGSKVFLITLPTHAPQDPPWSS